MTLTSHRVADRSYTSVIGAAVDTTYGDATCSGGEQTPPDGALVKAPLVVAMAIVASCISYSGTAAATEGTGEPMFVQGIVDGAADPGQRARGAAGAKVWATWLPGLAAANVGDEIRPVVLASGKADADGRFALRLRPSAAVKNAIASHDGWLNVDLHATDDQGADGASIAMSRQLGQLGRWADHPGRGQGPSDDVLVKLGAAESSDESTAANSNSNLRSAESQAQSANAGSVPCSFVVTATPVRSMRVLNFHTASNAFGRWEYGLTADSDMEVAVDAGGDGTWGISGTYHVGNSDDSKVYGETNLDYHRYTRTNFRFTEGYYKPYGIGTTCDGTSRTVNTKTATATSWAGGVGDDTGSGSEFRSCLSSPQSNYRGNYPVNTGLYRGSSRATKIGFTADLGPVNVGGTSGHSSNLDMEWAAKRGNGIYLCGLFGDVTGNFGIIFAQNR